MEWFSFQGWDCDAFKNTFAVRTWVTDEAPKPMARTDVDAKVREFVAACPDARLERMAPDAAALA